MNNPIYNYLLESLQRRYATKIFDANKKLSDIDISTLGEVLRMTPSSFWIQPWKFIIIEDQILREQIKPLSWGQRQVTEASHLIVLCAQEVVNQTDITSYINTLATAWDLDSNEILAKRDETGKVNRILHHFSDNHASDYQVHIALGFLLSACAILRIDACPMGWFDKVWVSTLLGLDNTNYHAVMMCAIGYRSSDDKNALLPKARFPLEQIVERR